MDVYSAAITHKYMGRVIIDVVTLADHEQALAEKDAELARWKARNWDENVRFIAAAKENLLNEYIHLTELYGEQKHEIRRLKGKVEQTE
jgi:hypothetical protein